MTEEQFDNNFIVDSMRWSFSRLSSFYNCHRSWKEKYINCASKMKNAFASYGSLCHSCLEKFFKGELAVWDLAEEYEKRYSDEVSEPFPPNAYADLGEKYHQQGLEYFENFEFDDNKYEVLGIEEQIEFKILDKDFIGFIDLRLQDKETGEMIIADHKSASIKFCKNGKPSKQYVEKLKEYERQLYLYSIPFVENGQKIDYLMWNFFRDQNIYKIPWKEEDYKEAIQWAEDTLKLIENEKEYEPKFDYYYCVNLCDVRMDCPYKRLGLIYQGIYAKCYSEKNKDYMNFGAAGIQLCDDWKNDMYSFFKWALDSGYDNELVLQRYDENENYDVFNCYWGKKSIEDEYFPE